jgi:hypothetical protein
MAFVLWKVTLAVSFVMVRTIVSQPAYIQLAHIKGNDLIAMRVCVAAVGPLRASRPCNRSPHKDARPRQDGHPRADRRPQKARGLQDSDDRHSRDESAVSDFSAPITRLSIWL